MKKRAFIAIAVLTLFFVSPRELAANKLRFGVVTDKSISFTPFLWTAGVDFDFHIAGLWLSPEVYMTVHNFDFGTIWVAPAVLLNYSVGKYPTGFYFGGGITKWWRLGPEVAGTPSADIALKLNAAICDIINGVTMTVFMVSPFNNIFKEMTFGVVFGF